MGMKPVDIVAIAKAIGVAEYDKARDKLKPRLYMADVSVRVYGTISVSPTQSIMLKPQADPWLLLAASIAMCDQQPDLAGILDHALQGDQAAGQVTKDYFTDLIQSRLKSKQSSRRGSITAALFVEPLDKDG